MDQIALYRKQTIFKRPLHNLKVYLARQYARLYSSNLFVGVTGSVGKTTCVKACAAVLSCKYQTLATNPNLDPTFSIPLTLLKLNPAVKKVILEMGVEHKNDMDFYLSLVKPKFIILTNISYAHSETLGSINDILQEKGKLIENLDEDGVAIMNWDDISCRRLSENCKGKVIYYGTNPQSCPIWAGNIRIENLKTVFELNFGVERVKVNYQLLGLHQIYSALAAATLGVVCGIPLTKIKLALESIMPLEHFLQPVTGPNGSIILDDTFSNYPASLESAIDTLLQIPARRKILVLGEMKHLGKFSENLHRSMAQRIYKEKLDLVFLGQGDTQIMADELKNLGFWEERIYPNLQNSQMVSKLLKTLIKGDVVLIKGAKDIRLDEVVKRIAKK